MSAPIHEQFARAVVRNKRALSWCCIVFELVLVFAAGAVAMLAVDGAQPFRSLYYQWGVWAGGVALALYMFTLLPSILTRLQVRSGVLFSLRLALMSMRRHIGILTFVFAFVHYIYMQFLPIIVRFGFLDASKIIINSHRLVGLAAFLILFVMWLTSNDPAMRLLGKWWKRLHNLTHLAIFFLFAHVALVSSWWTPVFVALLVVWAFSWWQVYGKK